MRRSPECAARARAQRRAVEPGISAAAWFAGGNPRSPAAPAAAVGASTARAAPQHRLGRGAALAVQVVHGMVTVPMGGIRR